MLTSCFSIISEELRDHFGKYGEIESINVKTDPQTGRSRGFAFIVFTNTEAIDKVSAADEHIINSKKVDPKKAKARHGKIFVGGLTTEISDEEIKTYFGQFGNVSNPKAVDLLEFANNDLLKFFLFKDRRGGDAIRQAKVAAQRILLHHLRFGAGGDRFAEDAQAEDRRQGGRC